EANLVVEAEMVGDCQHLEGARAWRKDVQLDGHDVLLVMWNSDSLRCGIQCYPARPAACVDRPDASASRLKCSSMPGQPPSTSLRMEAPASAPSRSNLRCSNSTRVASVPCAMNLTSTSELTVVSGFQLLLRSQLMTKRSGGSHTSTLPTSACEPS